MKNTNERLKNIVEPDFNRREFLRFATSIGLLSLLGTQEANAFSSKAQGKIVIIGGGAAGMSMAARLNKWLKEPDITLIDPSDRQYYQPGFTLIASGVYDPEDVWKKQESFIPKGVKWVKDSVVAVDPIKNKVATAKSGEIGYDFLVLTPGLQLNWDRVEGISYNSLGEGNAHCMYDFEGAQKTWKAIQEFAKTGGKGLYTDTHTKHKCGGAPKKICLLTEHYARKQKARDNISLNFYTASKELYDVPYFTPRLLEIYGEREIPINLNVKLKGIDTASKVAHFEKIETIGEEKIATPFTESYDFMHFLPPMSAPDFIREAGLGWTEGKFANENWVMVDKETFVHKNYANIISLGDCSDLPTSKTSAAIRMQVPLAAKNLISLMEGKEPVEKYNGYAACPIVTDYGHVLMCEFDYKKERLSSFPFSMMDMSKESRLAWLLKVYILKPLFFHGMLRGRS
ncbi:sulfide:quinone oxidoreductase [Parabacteroides sp. PF5-5]|uniref:NAD(P)/FAD-dependent oxidoreductase n=1 Tax=unclassified Parabacteroides TaxID=2649774 RepID=UPI002475A4FE|nr:MULTISPECIES: FAD/NAD(P)-binding oxidoreductase [unclassified Parabacteroides]MDH6303621.1 sulfide:quinone oxidoreductase [Parabacteroides sp. PH5-39]MDH6314943.1 sulfide:quinone oxidoreductase [Parabacteroides sp. PF5-13]MDH6318280.1 sulfide:quinone oxidoreductase [Parabacteroides sp. PH5-13]MDH6321787.1 sulfide:quinone oxidoreductase [Parabacteroides sp. PH5-8]MDH6325911.1 sulfide:quinone oxidoreductase [Parabacteroides sp. PH5-41]